MFQEGSVDLAHNSDSMIVMVDLGADPVRQLDVILAELARSQVSPQKLESNANILKTSSGGVQLLAAGRLGCTCEEVVSLMKNYGMSNAIIRITGDVTLDNIEDVILETNIVYRNRARKPTIFSCGMNCPSCLKSAKDFRVVWACRS